MKIVEAQSVKDYLTRYYKKPVTDNLIASYEDELKLYGYICTSRHDNILGEIICWPKQPAWVIK